MPHGGIMVVDISEPSDPRMIDISDPTTPTVEAEYRLPENFPVDV